MTDIDETPKPTKRRRRMAREPQPASAKETHVEALASGSAPSPAKPASKVSVILRLLQRAEGATIAQLAEVTGWLPHTTRASLSGLKKKGHMVTSTKAAGEERVYRVAAS